MAQVIQLSADEPSSIAILMSTEALIDEADKTITAGKNIRKMNLKTAIISLRSNDSLDASFRKNLESIYPHNTSKKLEDDAIYSVLALIALTPNTQPYFNKAIESQDLLKDVTEEQHLKIDSKLKEMRVKLEKASTAVDENNVTRVESIEATLLKDQKSSLESTMKKVTKAAAKKSKNSNKDKPASADDMADSDSSKPNTLKRKNRDPENDEVDVNDKKAKVDIDTRLDGLDATLNNIDEKLKALDKIESIVGIAKEAKAIASEAKAKADRVESDLKILDKKVDDKLKNISIPTTTTKSTLNSTSEYVMMLQRQEVTYNQLDKLSKKLEITAHPETIVSKLEQKIAPTSQPSSTKRGKNDKYRICPAKLKDFINSTLKLQVKDIKVGRVSKRGAKFAIEFSCKLYTDVNLILENRKLFGAVTNDPKKNCSVHRPLCPSLQRAHGLLNDLRVQGVIEVLNVTRGGNICVGIGEIFRTITDINEALYYASNKGEVTESLLLRFNKRDIFVSSNLEVLEVPARFKAKKAKEMSDDDSD